MIRFFAAHPTAANLLMLLFLVMGLIAVPQVRRETFPDFTEDQVQVRVEYPGASPEDIEDAICRRIEDAIEGVNYVDEVLSEAAEGLGTVTATMEEGADFQQFIDDIRTETEAITDFPPLAERPIIRELNRTDAVVSVAVTGPDHPPTLKAYCEDLKERLQRLDPVSLVPVAGFSDHQIRIELPAETLMESGLSVDDVAEVIARQSVDLPAGVIETRERDILVRFVDERRSPEEFAELVVLTSPSGAEVRLGDIAARITDRFEQDERKILFSGRRAGLLEVTKTKTEDTLTVFDAVQGFVRREQADAPAGVKLALTQDVSSIVRNRLTMLVTNGWQGLVLVFVVMWLFFAFRFSFWVAMGLPVSFLGALFFLPLLGLSINMITMVGLLLAIGLLMDDAIVIAENIATHLTKGEGVLDAVVEGTREVKGGVLCSFLTTVSIFLPISFLAGRIGRVMEAMPVVLILVLSVSLVEAFLILPHHLAHAFRKGALGQQGRFRRRFDAALGWVRDVLLGQAVALLVRWRYLVVGIAAMLLLVSLAMVAGGLLKFQAFPDIDGNVVEARLLLPQGTPLGRTETVVERLTEALSRVNAHFRPRQPRGQDLVQAVNVQFAKNVDAYESGPHVATVTADLLPAETRDAPVDDILSLWRKETGTPPGVISLKFAEPGFGPAGRPLDIQVQGDNLAELQAAAQEILDWLGQLAGVYDLSQDLRPGKPEVRLRLRDGAASLGLTAHDLASQLRAAYFGKTAAEIQVGPESYEIDVQLHQADQDTLADLVYFHVTLPDGSQVPLSAVAVAEEGRSYARIARVDGQRAVRVQGEVDTQEANTAEVLTLFQEEFLPDFRQRHPTLRVTLKGEAEESQITQGSLLRGFLLGVVGIYLILSFLFRSYIEPVIVMLAIPLALTGVIWGHLVMGLELSLPSVLGFVSLAGIVVNDSILLVEFIRLRRRQGDSVLDAAAQASRDRFRAVLLTSLTTTAGLLPLLAERSLQAQVLIPLATSLVFGLMASTVLILVFMPVVYAVLSDLGLTRDPA
jgi:multidrug efflux pump subunit AcrB